MVNTWQRRDYFLYSNPCTFTWKRQEVINMYHTDHFPQCNQQNEFSGFHIAPLRWNWQAEKDMSSFGPPKPWLFKFKEDISFFLTPRGTYNRWRAVICYNSILLCNIEYVICMYIRNTVAYFQGFKDNIFIVFLKNDLSLCIVLMVYENKLRRYERIIRRKEKE